ncbi:MAG: LamG domain-containing protein [Myxococcota bacterium]
MRCRHVSVVALVLAIAGCGDAKPAGPTFEVSFDPSTPRTARDQAVRVEVYLVDSCDGVTMGTRPVPSIASTFILRDGAAGSLGADLEPGSYGLYGVAQDADCAVVAAGCNPVEITGEDALAVSLGLVQGAACAADQSCSLETGNCVDGTGGTGGMGGAGASAGVGGAAGTGGAGGMSGAGGAGGMGGSPLTRVDNGLILLYAFDEGSGSTVTDRSGVSPSHDLTIADPSNVTWSSDHLTIDSATVLTTAGAASKVYSRVVASRAITVEAWVRPASLVPVGTPPDRLITMSAGTSSRNFLLGHDGTHYAARFRADGEMDNNGNPTVETSAGTATTGLTHVVFTHQPDGSEVVYINGAQDVTFARMGDPTTWNSSYAIAVANETSVNREWLGDLHLIAVYERALGPDEVQQNFDVGP